MTTFKISSLSVGIALCNMASMIEKFIEPKLRYSSCPRRNQSSFNDTYILMFINTLLLRPLISTNACILNRKFVLNTTLTSIVVSRGL